MGTLTTNLGLDKPTVGADADQWGTLLNQSLDTLDLSVQFGVLTKSVAGAANVTLTANEAAKDVLVFTGALTANIAVIIPNTPLRRYAVRNSTTGAFTLTVRRAIGTGVVIPQGTTLIVHNDGTDVVFEGVNSAESAKAVGVNGVNTASITDNAVTLPKLLDIPTATFLARSAAGTGDPETLTSAQASAIIPDKIQPIAATVAANALTVTLNPTTLDFRSATLGSGVVNTRRVATAITLTAPTGATLGAVNGQPARLVVLAIDNAGTVELAVINLAGATNLDESGVINTTAISAASTLATVAYSTAARTNVPYRVIGFIDSTQATAGTYATAPTLVQGAGGNSLQHVAAIVSLPSVAASGTSVDFVGIPVWAKRVNVFFNALSTNGSSVILIQIGAGAVQTTGYLGASSNISGSAVAANFTNGFGIRLADQATSVLHGSLSISLISGSTWSASGTQARSDVPNVGISSGTVILAGALDRVRVTTVGGTDTFDAGSISISYE